MDISWLSAKVIESSNFFWCFVSLYLWYRCGRYKNYSDTGTHDALQGLQWMFLGSALNHGWFAVSRQLRTDGYWNAMMFEWRGLWVFLTACLFVYGSLMVVRHLESASINKLGVVALGLAVVSFSIGFF